MTTTALATQILAACNARGLVIATAESCTGGLIAGAITNIAGSSAIFDRGFVTYSNAAKAEMLGVSPETIVRLGAVSEDVAHQMAAGALARSDADISIAVTGVAGPGGTVEKPEGMVCFGWATKESVGVFTKQFGAIGRENVRRETVRLALQTVLDRIETVPPR